MNAVPSFGTNVTSALKATTSVLEITCTLLGVTRTDKTASAQGDAAHRAAAGTTKTQVNRLSGAKLIHDRFANVQREVRDNGFAFTSKWGEKSQRLLPHANLEAWAVRHMQLVRDHDDLLQELEDKADAILSTAETGLGEYANRIRPPTRSELLGAYSISHKVSPFPDDSVWDHLPTETANYLKHRNEMDNQAAFQAGQADYLKRVAEPVEYLIARLEAYDEREKRVANGEKTRDGNFHASSLTNVQDVLAVLPSLNITNDPAIAALGDRLKLLMGIDADRLKSEPDTRAKAIADMKSAFADSLLPGA